MSEGSSKSWGTTIITGVIILVLVVIAVIVIYYVFSIKSQTLFPLSPFVYGDVVQISPVVFTQDNFTEKYTSENQYLTLTVCEGSDGCSNCYQPQGREECDEPQPKVCTVTFTGDKSKNNTKWTLTQYVGDNTEAKFSAEQNFTEFGNRFYLQNLTSNSPNDFSKMMTSMAISDDSGSDCVWGGSITFPVTGNGIWEPNAKQSFGVPFVAYFLPTRFPDLYYILFPGINSVIYPNATRINDSICSLRPFAQPNRSTYNPWNGKVPNDNSLLLNSLVDFSQGDGAIGTNAPDIFLFKIIKV